MIEYYDAAFKPSRFLLWITGMRPFKNHVTPLVFSSLTIQAVVTSLTTISFLYDRTFLDFVDIIVTEFVNVYSISRLGTFIYFEEDLQKISEDMEMLWPITDPKLHKMLKYLKYFQNMLLTEVVLVVATAYTHGFITGERALHFYKPEIIPEIVFEICLVDGFYMFVAFFGVGFDLFFLTLTGLVMVQYKILNGSLQSCIWDVEQQKEFVKHTNLLKRITDRINTIYGPMLLGYVTVIVIVLGMLMYIIYERNGDPLDFLKYFILIVAICIEMFVCFIVPAQLLTNEINQMYTAIYCTNWYECPVPVKKSLVMMLTRNKKTDAVINATGKLMEMNFGACTTMLKTGFSVFTFLLHMKNFRSGNVE